jgi:hypothetical protein
MNEEATAIFYGRNEFGFTYHVSASLVPVLDSMGRNVILLRNFRIDFPLAQNLKEEGE